MNIDLATVVIVALLVIFMFYVALHGSYLLLIVLGAFGLRDYNRRINFGEFERIADSELTLPITLILPAYNEEQIIVGSVIGALALKYPQFEVMVVNDGSTDATLQKLIRHFNLRKVDKQGQLRIPTQRVRGIYESVDHPGLVVVDKENGRRGDAINAGANLSRYPLLCVTDADSVFEDDAMLRAVRPFLLNTRVVAAGGIVRPSNGMRIENGRIIDHRVPRKMLPLVQAVEYLRSFQWARMGLARLRSMLCISGAFLVVRKEVFMALHGSNADSITDDIDFTVRLHEWIYRQPGRDRPLVEYIPDPVCYTEVPESMRIFASQRNRWQRGTLEALFRRWTMTFNPRYGITGMFGMPFFMLFEGFAAVIELLGIVLAVVAWFLGLVTLPILLLYLALAILLGTFLSVSAVLLQERTRGRVGSTGDLLRLLWAGLVNNFGYHQLHLLFRVGGTFDYLVRGRRDLGKMERYSTFESSSSSAPR